VPLSRLRASMGRLAVYFHLDVMVQGVDVIPIAPEPHIACDYALASINLPSAVST